jgi:hypothetical protein
VFTKKDYSLHLCAFLVLLEKLWIEADDLKHPVVQCKYERPRCRPNEVHFMVLEKVSVLEKGLPRTIEVAPGSPTTAVNSECQDSPSYSGNSSVVVQLSGASSRRTSLCSSDGIAPTSNLRKELSDSIALPTEREGPKNKLLHIPRYKPYLPRSKREAANAVFTDPKVAQSTDTDVSDASIAGKDISFSSSSLANLTQMSEFQEALGVELDDFYTELLTQQHQEPVVDGKDTLIQSDANDALLETLNGISSISSANAFVSDGAGSSSGNIVQKDEALLDRLQTAHLGSEMELKETVSETLNSSGVVPGEHQTSGGVVVTENNGQHKLLVLEQCVITKEDEAKIDFGIEASDDGFVKISDEELDEILNG